jgi:hypothetical protein
MKTNVDCEIYLSNFIGFFDKNPNDLIALIGQHMDKSKFYEKVRTQVYSNHENGDEITLTQKQIIDILVSLHNQNKIKNYDLNKVKIPFLETKYGKLFLN